MRSAGPVLRFCPYYSFFLTFFLKINLDKCTKPIYFVFQSAFMKEQEQPLEELQHIKRMMEQSGRFISLSGLSGISAGICALIGAYLGHKEIEHWLNIYWNGVANTIPPYDSLVINLGMIAIGTFVAAFLSAFLFTYLLSKKSNKSMWTPATLRLFWNTVIPLGVGGIFICKMIAMQYVALVAPGCLIFYGLSLVNASKYTLGEIRYLGYGQLVLGIINLSMIGDGLYFWALGFGVLHIIYGVVMWWKYEKEQ
jgi:hypothetical protein